MDLVLLKTFLKVVAFGNITKAAAVLFVTQSAVSRRIQQLESYAGQPLLERSGPLLSPTEAGRVLVEKARRMLDLEQELMESLGAAKSRQKLSICCTPALGMNRMPEVFSQFLATHAANVDLNCVFIMPEEALAGVESGRFDVAIIEHCNDIDTRGFATHSLPPDQFFLVSAPPLGLPAGEVSLEEIFPLRLYLKHEKGCAKRFIDWNFSRLGRSFTEFSGAVFFDDFPFIRDQVLAGRGVTFVSSGIVAEELEKGLLQAHQITGFDHCRTRTMILGKVQLTPQLVELTSTMFQAFGVPIPEQLAQ